MEYMYIQFQKYLIDIMFPIFYGFMFYIILMYIRLY